MDYSALDIYNAMSDAENGFDSGALERLCGTDSNLDDDDDDLDYDDVYSPEELALIKQYHEDHPNG